MKSRHRFASRRRGSVVVLVVLIVGVVFVIGLMFLSGTATTTTIGVRLTDHAQARQAAESGIMAAIRYVEQTDDWRSQRATGPWITDLPVASASVSVTGQFDPNPIAATVTVDDQSFETEVATLPTPLLNPPLSGTIGGWNVERTSLLSQLGTAMPLLGVEPSPNATDGARMAYIHFRAAVLGNATFRQTLDQPLKPNTEYAFSMDVGRTDLLTLMSDVQFRVYGGATLIASATHPSDYELIQLAGEFENRTLRFTTSASPPAGNITIEVYATALAGVLSKVYFDNAHFEEVQYGPLVLNAVGRHGQTSHSATAVVSAANAAGPAAIVKWSEP